MTIKKVFHATVSNICILDSTRSGDEDSGSVMAGNEINGGGNDRNEEQNRKPMMSTTANISETEEINEVTGNTNGTSGRGFAKTSYNLIVYTSLAGFCGLLIVALVIIFYSPFARSHLGLNKLRLSRESIQ